MAENTVQRPTAEALAIYAARFNDSAALKTMSTVLSFPQGERVHLETIIQPWQRGGLSGTPAVNGGVLSALFDLAIGCTPALVDPTRKTATVQLSMTFERGVMGERIRVHGKVERATSSFLFSSATLYDENDQACARCLGVVRMSHKSWGPPGTPITPP